MNYSIHKSGERRKKRNWKNSWLVLALLAVVLVFSIRASWRVYQSKTGSLAAASLKEEELKKLEERERFLKAELEKGKTAEGKEQMLREKFGLVRPGEQVAIIIESEESAASSSARTSFWSKMKSFFGGLFER